MPSLGSEFDFLIQLPRPGMPSLAIELRQLNLNSIAKAWNAKSCN